MKLECGDERALAARDEREGVQVLFWDFTNNQPEDVNNQSYYITDIKPSMKSSVDLRIANLDPGRYLLSVYRVGYRINDPFADYFDLGSPSQLTREQVAFIQNRNNGSPVQTETIDIQIGQVLARTYIVRDNDVYLISASRV